MSKFLEKAFGFDSEKHTVRTEILAGITTFLTMAYILAVNPSIFSALDMPKGAVFTATALAALIGTLVMSLYARKPFALAPGMGLNAFFVFTVCLTMGHSWQFALTAVFLEGILFIILTLTKVRSWILNAIPLSLKHAIGAGILLAEVQQSSDVTYRIFDYNRPGMDGRPRELHTELAAQALDYHVEREYRTVYDENVNRANLIVDSPYFSVRVTETAGLFHRNLLKYDSFVITMCIEGDCHISLRATGEEFFLREGSSVLIPAVLADYDVIPTGSTTRFLDAFIDNMDRSLVGKVTRFLHF